jgi:MFS family permease
MNNDLLRRRLSIPFFFIDMILFGIAIGFLDASTVIPEFVGKATDSKVLVGLSGILFAIGWRLPQLAFAPAANRAPNKRRWMLTFALPGRVAFFLVAFVAIAIGKDNPGLMLLTFFVAYGGFAILDGITSLAWVELIGSAVPDNLRGMMFSASQIIQGVLILGVQGVLRELLGEHGPGYPANYAVVFIIAATFFTISTFFLTNVYESKDKKPEKARNIEAKDFLPYLKSIAWGDRPFRDFLVMRFFLDAAFYMVSPFYIGYETEKLGIPSGQAVSDSLVAVMVGNVIGSLLSTWFSQKLSARAVIWMMIVAAIVGPSLVLVSPLVGYVALLIAFFTIGLIHSAGAPGLLNWMIAYPEPGNRPIYSGIANTVSMFALVAPVLGGLILQLTNYSVLFGLSLVLALICAVNGLRLVNPSIKTKKNDTYPVPDV